MVEQQDWIQNFLARHRVSRRTALKGGASALAALGLTTAPWAQAAYADAASRQVGIVGRHLSFGLDPTRQMAVAAELTAEPTGKVSASPTAPPRPTPRSPRRPTGASPSRSPSPRSPTRASTSTRQLQWLQQKLADFRADPNVDFIVAFFHHCAFATSTAHASDAGVRAALAPLFDTYGVDLVVQGHNHQYERSNPIKGGKSGAPETSDGSQARYLDYAFLKIEVKPGVPGGRSSMRIRAISDLGQEIDSVELVRTRALPGRGREHGAGWTVEPSSGLSIPA